MNVDKLDLVEADAGFGFCFRAVDRYSFSGFVERVVSGSDDCSACLFCLGGSFLLSRLSGHLKSVLYVDFSWDSQWLVTTSEDCHFRI